MAILEWGAFISSLFYLYFAVINKPICFIFGIIGSAIWAVVSYNAGLKFDAALQVFYVIISFVGIYNWSKGGDKASSLPISDYSHLQHLLIICLGIIASSILIYLSKFVDFINLPVLDATTTVFLVIGTLLLITRKLSSWIYLIVADVFYIYIYGQSGLWLFVGMMILYIIFGVSGFLNWKTIREKQDFKELI